MTAKMPPVHPSILEASKKVTAKRARVVLDHIIAHGQITTEELKDVYGYDHPPRAARDVREQGIPLVTISVPGKGGRQIGAYVFGDPSEVASHKLGGRKVFSKRFKQTLIDRDSSRCAVCCEVYDERYLSIDHRIPYEVAGDAEDPDSNPAAFMLLCGTCQRKKSWSCEHCQNWTGAKDKGVCGGCFWATPESYAHIALQPIRRCEVVWVGEEVGTYDALSQEAARSGVPIHELIKRKAAEK